MKEVSSHPFKNFFGLISAFLKKNKKFFKKDLTNANKQTIIIRLSGKPACVALAQLDRVFGYEPKGRGFESLTPHQNKKAITKVIAFLF